MKGWAIMIMIDYLYVRDLTWRAACLHPLVYCTLLKETNTFINSLYNFSLFKKRLSMSDL